jgi:hypothetical protein
VTYNLTNIDQSAVDSSLITSFTSLDVWMTVFTIDNAKVGTHPLRLYGVADIGVSPSENFYLFDLIVRH